jgi:hypothetical protein
MEFFSSSENQSPKLYILTACYVKGYVIRYTLLRYSITNLKTVDSVD